MLLEFSVKNYRSIKDKVTLSMVASSDNDHPENVFEVDEPSRFRLLKSVGIYGANASGKSNVLRALGFMEDFVRRSATGMAPGDDIDVTPFKLDPETREQPSQFEVSFISEGQRYVYGFSVDRERVHEEWLTAARTSRSRALFHRYGDGNVEFGSTWKGERDRLVERTRPNALLLSVAAQFNNPLVEPLWNWLGGTLQSLARPSGDTADRVMTYVSFFGGRGGSDELAAFLAMADLGILGVEAVIVPLEETAPRQDAPSEDAHRGVERRQLFRRATAQVSMQHRAADGITVALDLDREESAGTQRLYSVAGWWVYLLEMGAVLLIDELEAHLHPSITRALLAMLHQSDTHAQLIFATHDCGLLDADLLRRDQVWFTEKDSAGATQLYSLWDFRPRKDENYRKGYLQGRYGAVPFVGEFTFGEDQKAERPQD